MAADIQGVSDNLLQHYKTEEKTLDQILFLEQQFRDHAALVKCETESQKDLVSRLWVLSQRYTLIASAHPYSKVPEITGRVEETIYQEFCDTLKTLRDSNRRICASVRQLRKSCRVFDELCSQLDMKLESPFIIGDTYHKPLSFFIEFVDDLFQYFNAWLLKLKLNSHLIEPFSSERICYYKSLIEPSEDFDEYLHIGLQYCKCLRPKIIC